MFLASKQKIFPIVSMEHTDSDMETRDSLTYSDDDEATVNSNNNKNNYPVYYDEIFECDEEDEDGWYPYFNEELSNIIRERLIESGYNFQNQYGKINSANIHDFQVLLFDLKDKKGKTYGFKIVPNDEHIITRAFDGIISTHSQHHMLMWHPIWIPAIYDEDGYNVAIETKWNTYVSALVTVTSSR
jgi:hypothetical protein